MILLPQVHKKVVFMILLPPVHKFFKMRHVSGQFLDLE